MAKLKKVLEVMATSKIFPRLGRNGRFTQGYRRAYRIVVCLDNSLSSDERQTRKLFVEPKGTPGHMARHPVELNLRSPLPTIWKLRIFDFEDHRMRRYPAFGRRLVTKRA